MKPRRVVVTGLGVVSAMGYGREAFERELKACRTGLRASSLRSVGTLMLGVVPGERERTGTAGLDSFARFALEAAEEAVADAGIAECAGFRERTAVLMGNSNGGDEAREEAWERTSTDRRPHPLTVVRGMANAGASAVAMRFGLRGPVLTFSTACASSGHAIGQALQMVRMGMADFAIAGGAEGLPGNSQMGSWQQLRVMSQESCRPFAADRNGISLAEGAGVLVLEPLEAAQARSAKVYAELAGFAMGSDGGEDWVNADPAGMLRCMQGALADAEMDVSELGYVNAHATGTMRGDASEAEAIRALLGKNAAAVSSTKALHGHALGATGALEAVATVMAVAGRWLPGMPKGTPDEAMGLNLVWQAAGAEPAPMLGNAALSNSFGFGGLNAALVFRQI